MICGSAAGAAPAGSVRGRLDGPAGASAEGERGRFGAADVEAMEERAGWRKKEGSPPAGSPLVFSPTKPAAAAIRLAPEYSCGMPRSSQKKAKREQLLLPAGKKAKNKHKGTAAKCLGPEMAGLASAVSWTQQSGSDSAPDLPGAGHAADAAAAATTTAPQQQCLIISVYNFKGGVGKTTIASNLGAALFRNDKRVLLVDLDMQCNLTALFARAKDEDDDEEDESEATDAAPRGPADNKKFVFDATMSRIKQLRDSIVSAVTSTKNTAGCASNDREADVNDALENEMGQLEEVLAAANRITNDLAELSSSRDMNAQRLLDEALAEMEMMRSRTVHIIFDIMAHAGVRSKEMLEQSFGSDVPKRGAGTTRTAVDDLLSSSGDVLSVFQALFATPKDLSTLDENVASFKPFQIESDGNAVLDLMQGNQCIADWQDKTGEALKITALSDIGFIGAALRTLAKKRNYDYVVVDLGPSNGTVNETVILNSDLVLPPLCADRFSLSSACGFIDTVLTSWEERRNLILRATEDAVAKNRGKVKERFRLDPRGALIFPFLFNQLETGRNAGVKNTVKKQPMIWVRTIEEEIKKRIIEACQRHATLRTRFWLDAESMTALFCKRYSDLMNIAQTERTAAYLLDQELLRGKHASGRPLKARCDELESLQSSFTALAKLMDCIRSDRYPPS